MHHVLAAWTRCTPATRLAMLAVLTTPLNAWLGLTVGLASAWLYARQPEALAHVLDRHRTLAYFTPVLLALAYLSQGVSMPADDLMRHLTAWRIGLDYRAQYPWSEVPQPNLWLGFDYLMGMLQQAGLSKEGLLQWVPGASLLLQSGVLFLALERALPAHRHHAGLFLLTGALGLLLLTPRSLLGRPEMFLLSLGAAAWLCRTRAQAALWAVGYLALVPAYWLGWVYAPMALLLAPAVLSVAQRVGLAAGLGLLHLAFWQAYTGDYPGLLLWLKGTLSVLASENDVLLSSLGLWPVWVLVAALSLALSTLNPRRAWQALPVLLLVVWFALPNQIRYLAALGFVALPWMYRTLALAAQASSLRVSPVAVLLALGVAAALTVKPTPAPAPFALGASARVYSESPYATVFYGQPGIAVEPSFALGATRAEWKGLKQDGVLRCDRLQAGRFTHVIEQSLVQPLACAELTAVHGPWRLWTLTSPAQKGAL